MVQLDQLHHRIGQLEAASEQRADLRVRPAEGITFELREATDWMVAQSDMQDRFAGAVPYLRAFARVLGAQYHLQSAVAEADPGPRTRLARFYIKRLLPEYHALLPHVREGAGDLYALTVEDLSG